MWVLPVILSYSVALDTKGRSTLISFWSPLPSAPPWPSAWINESDEKLPMGVKRKKKKKKLPLFVIPSTWCETGSSSVFLARLLRQSWVWFHVLPVPGCCYKMDEKMWDLLMYLGAEQNLFSQNPYSSVRAALWLLVWGELEGLGIGNSMKNPELGGMTSNFSAGILTLIICSPPKP